ncbi:hypothetical protein BXZ70DRAFT_1004460 [Cristinia sonorae]|uniref:Cytochrome c oxidase subunit 8, mitochondrial n=1 Tax=Cristinia sonorae TaxID=1940300 RepID=A0A8K0XU03_9AGAR|nr:hypothetical protein BXZ70DRAFT_1004460 [Cristinia sonorae]
MSLIAARASLKHVGIRRAGLRYSSGHGQHETVPFSHSNKGTFALKVTAFLIAGFSIPFIASAYQIKKSAGGA